MRVSTLSLLCSLFCATAPVYADFETGQSADLVLGKPDFTTDPPPAFPLRYNLGAAGAIAEDPTTGKIFVADSGNSRVLRFASASALQNGANAEAVIGQADYISGTANQGNASPTAQTLSTPYGIYVDYQGNLWVSDSGNSRILCYGKGSDLPEFNATALFVVGQPNMTSNTQAATAAGLDQPRGIWVSPEDVAVDGPGTLWVADWDNSRVVHYNNAFARGYNGGTPVNGISADGVIGQANFTTSTTGNTRQKLRFPNGITGDRAGYIYVADTGNCRVLIFGNAANINGLGDATKVLGQLNFTQNQENMGNAASPSAGSMSFPDSVATSGGRLFVADSSNYRVLWFDDGYSTVKPNGQDADGVIGQQVFTTQDFGVTASTVGVPSGLAVTTSGQLWVTDSSNYRALRFSSVVHPTPTPAPAPSVPTVTTAGKKKISTTRSSVTIKGTATDAARVEIHIGKSKKVARGTTSWSYKLKLKPGKNTVLVQAISATGAASSAVHLVITRQAP